MQTKVTKFIKILSVCLAITAITQKAYAEAYHIFTNIAYDNPASLNSVKKMDFTLGETYLDATFIFNGSDGPLSGRTTSSRWTAFPYGRIAYRVHPKLVLGVDVTSYEYADIQYPLGSILSPVSTATILKGYDISPRLSYQVNQKLAVGIGLTADNIYKAQFAFVVPPYQLINTGSDWRVGGVVGLFYAINPLTFFNMSYYSRLSHQPSGKSTWGPFTNNNMSMNIPIPAVLSANLTRVLTPKWVVSGTARYVMWNLLNTFSVKNTALNGETLFFHLKYHNAWSGQLATHYQVTDKLGLGGTVIFESSAQPLAYRPVGLPTYSVWSFGIGPDYAITKSLSVKLLYGYGFSNPNINTNGPIGPLLGNMRIHGNMLDLSLNYHL